MTTAWVKRPLKIILVNVILCEAVIKVLHGVEFPSGDKRVLT
jgi:hypothetical protein